MVKNKPNFALSLCSLVLIIFTWGCKKSSTEPENVPQALAIESATFTIYAGGSLQLSAKMTFSDGSVEDVTNAVRWTALDGSKGEVSADGVFSAWSDALGSETIRAFYKGLQAESQINITARAVTLTSWPVQLTIKNSASHQFEAVAQFHDATADFINSGASWSLHPGVAGSISQNGLFQANTGMTGAETLRVQFQDLQVESYLQVSATGEPPFSMAGVPAGTFLMGDDNGAANERPAHQVQLEAFEIGTHEITNEQYARYLNEAFRLGEITYSSGVIAAKKGPYTGYIYAKILGSEQYSQQHIVFFDTGSGAGEFRTVFGFENHPVVRMDWYGAMAFCQFYGLRLPTEAEWEMACRGGLQYEYGTATGEMNHDLANYEGFGGADRFVAPAPVGSFPANPFGLFDMSGNVAEFVFDAYQANYYAGSPSQNPRGPGPERVLGQLPGGFAIWRGGAWIHSPAQLRAAARGAIRDQADNSQLSQSVVGFRVARSAQ